MNTWGNILSKWEYVLPPSRPSTTELLRIKKLLINYSRDEPVAVLGSTIEYRDLLYELGFKKVYIFEKNINFYNSLKSWKVNSTENEIIVKGDWVESIITYKAFFNFVLSDLTMGNILYGQRNTFYRSIFDSLKYGGLFIDKVLTNELPYLTLNNIYDKYKYTAVNLRTVNNFSCEALFCSELLEDRIVDTTKFYNVLKQCFNGNMRLMKFIDKSHLITPENCIWFYGKPWEELKEHYFSFYKYSVLYDDEINSPYYGRMKHIINHKEKML